MPTLEEDTHDRPGTGRSVWYGAVCDADEGHRVLVTDRQQRYDILLYAGAECSALPGI